MAYQIVEIEGVGSQYADQLTAAGIKTTQDLLSRCAQPSGRRALSEKTGISEKLILKWANHADLMRIAGVGPQFAELLEASGVDTVRELRHRNPENLADTMKQVNDMKNLAGNLPAASQVQEWVEQARLLTPLMTY